MGLFTHIQLAIVFFYYYQQVFKPNGHP